MNPSPTAPKPGKDQRRVDAYLKRVGLPAGTVQVLIEGGGVREDELVIVVCDLLAWEERIARLHRPQKSPE